MLTHVNCCVTNVYGVCHAYTCQLLCDKLLDVRTSMLYDKLLSGVSLCKIVFNI